MISIPFFLKNRLSNDLLESCSALLNHYNIKYTRNKLNEFLESHVEYPSLLAIKDTLNEYGVANVAVRKGSFNYIEFETPFICSIQKPYWAKASFVLVTSTEENQITYLDPENFVTTDLSIEEFERIDKGIVLLVDGSEAKDEIDYKKNKKEERLNTVIKQLPINIFLGISLLTVFFLLYEERTIFSWLHIGFIISSLSGVVLSSKILLYNIDSEDPFLKSVCGMLKKQSDCNAVLSSYGATFMGISWSIWGFSYFVTFFVSIIFFAGSLNNIWLWSLISVLASFYILFSLYYQWRVVRQWCPLCLTIQIILGINLVIGLISLSIFEDFQKKIDYHNVLSVFFIGMGVLVLAYLLIPIIKRAKDSHLFEKRWKKLHYNPVIFKYLLAYNESISISPEGLGIVLGNKSASTEIIKVCNPYCTPCSKAHPELISILKNNRDVKVRIIFTASVNDGDMRTAPVLHLLAIQDRYDDIVTHQALDDWYLSTKKNFTAFAAKYPINSELKEQKNQVKAMRDWCDTMKIRATPTFFINGRELPDSYEVKDLKNFF